MSEIAEVVTLVVAAQVALSEGERDAAIAKLLEAAAYDPLDDGLHAALSRACPFAPAEFTEQERTGLAGYQGVWKELQRRGGRLGFLFELLPELGELDESLLAPEVPGRGLRQKAPEKWFEIALGVPETLVGYVPNHPRASGFSSYYQPSLKVVDGVLHAQQFSTMEIKAWEISHETMNFVAYRVRGSLFHARWSRFQHYHYRR